MSDSGPMPGNGLLSVVSRLIRNGAARRVYAVVDGGQARYEPDGERVPRLGPGDEFSVTLKGSGSRLTVPADMDGFEVVRVQGDGELNVGGANVKVTRLASGAKLLFRGRPATLKWNGRLRV